VPWHPHSNVSDPFYVLEGEMRLFLQEPKEQVNLKPGEVYVVRPKRPHLVTMAAQSRSPSWFCKVSANMISFRSCRARRQRHDRRLAPSKTIFLED
jgi:quercetin dioxygenase-like cupin family protein